MIRPFTCVCAMLAGASGLYLYSEKHRTTLLDQQISGIVSDTQHIRERTAMLRAEWALLNQPDRLQGLATRFLPQLQSMAPTQFVQLASLDKRLPAPGPETSPHPIVTPQTAPALVGLKPATPDQAPAAETLAIAQANTAAVAARPIRLASLQMGHGPASHSLTAHILATRSAGVAGRPVAPHEVQLADADSAVSGADNGNAQATVPQAALRRVSAQATIHEAASRHPVARPAAPVRVAYAEPRIRPAVTAVSSNYARPPVLAAAAWRPAHASWPAPRPVTYSVPASGSALGSSLGAGRTALPAPVPLSDGN